MLSLPAEFEDLLKAYVKETYSRKKGAFSAGDVRFFAKGVAKLSDAFTAERGTLPKNYFNLKELRSGYILYFLPTNALKVAGLLKEFPPHFFKGCKKILDLGSGPATATLGVLLATQGRWTGSVTLVDQNKDILKDGQRLIERMHQAKLSRAHMNVTSLRRDFSQGPIERSVRPEPYDLVIAMNVLNEWKDPKRRLHLVEKLLHKYVSKKGRLLIIEPALRQQTRELMELHDALLEREAGTVWAPCLHQEKCPMLADNRRDWCHSYFEWKRPKLIEHLDELVGIRKEYLKASYLLLGTEQTPDRSKQWRVVSGPLNSKGKTERLLCGAQGLPHLRRLMRMDREASEKNRVFGEAQRGDIINVKAVKQVRKDDRVKRV